MGVLFHLVMSGKSLPLALLSPLEPIISTQEWRQSGRFRGDLLRIWKLYTPRFEILQQHSDCLAKAILAEM